MTQDPPPVSKTTRSNKNNAEKMGIEIADRKRVPGKLRVAAKLKRENRVNQ